MKSTSTAGRILRATGAAVLGLLIPAQPAFALAASHLADFSAPSPFATFGKLFNDSNVTVDGNAGISVNGTLSPVAAGTMIEDLDIGTRATVSGPATVGGSTFVTLELATAQTQGFSASTALGNLAADSVAQLNGVGHSDCCINGAPVIRYPSATVHGVNGAIFAGDEKITLMSGSSLMLISIGLGFLVVGKRKVLLH